MSYSSHNVNNSVKDTLVVLRNEYKYKIDLTTDLGTIPDIFCNSYELNQAFLNIIKNSIEAINEDKQLKTRLISIKTFADSNAVHIIICNNGPKIPDTIKNRIFDPFFTTKVVGAGPGLGLSITHDIIVNKHNGDIKIDNLDQGVQFHISLPIIEELDSEA
jgi:signal transduction histidine kinase